jgi:hypothetical protein
VSTACGNLATGIILHCVCMVRDIMIYMLRRFCQLRRVCKLVNEYANPSPSMQTRWLNVINKVVGKSGDRVCQLVCPLKYKWLVYGTYDNSWLYLIIYVLLNVCFICSIKFVHTPRRLLYEFTTCRLIVGKHVDGFVNSARLANTAWQYGTEFVYSLTVLHTG